MGDGSSSRRRVVMGRRLSDGEPVPVVLEATRDGYVAAFRAGVPEAVLFDPIGVSKMVDNLRDLQAIALRGVQW
jgi:hypothetical protein